MRLVSELDESHPRYFNFANTSPMSSRFESVVSALLTVAALTVAGAVLHREVFSDNPKDGPSAPRKAVGWDELSANAVEVGDPAAKLQIVEFVDFECPACGLFHRRTLEELRDSLGSGTYSLKLIYLPLRGHRFAPAAAVAAECADEQGMLPSFVNTIFRQQDSIGIKSWEALVLGAGVAQADSLQFRECIRRDQFDRIETHRRLAEKYEVRATPTVLVNGWRYDLPPSALEMLRRSDLRE